MLEAVHNSSARTLAIRRMAGVALAVLVGATGLAAAAPASAASPSVTISLQPQNGVLPSTVVTVAGQASTTRIRPIQLQWSSTSTGSYAVVAQGKTKRGGAYAISDSTSRAGYYRVFLPQVDNNGSIARAVTSDSARAHLTAGLANGLTLATGTSVTSVDGKYKLRMQKNGNLVLASVAAPNTLLWQTNTTGHKNVRLVMQYRGNLVLVDSTNSVLWQSNTSDDTASLYLYQSGRLAIRNSDGDKLWGSTGATTAGTSTAATRGDSWVASRVPYSQSRYFTNQYGTYRTDCSGFVSMMWNLPTSYTTRTIPGISTVISKSQLQPGDVLNAYNYHVVLFDGWANDAHTQYWAYEETPSTGAARHVIPYPYWSSSRPGSFVPRRLNAGVANARFTAAYLAKMSKGGDAGPTGNR